MLALDLGVFHRGGGHVVKVREAMLWSVAWISMAAIFAVIVLFWHGRTPALEFVTGYVIELSLSIDNLFVFLLIFRFFKVVQVLGEQGFIIYQLQPDDIAFGPYSFLMTILF